MIYWPLKEILKSKIFNKIVVSTDSKKIAKISKNLGAEIPFLRPWMISAGFMLPNIYTYKT